MLVNRWWSFALLSWLPDTTPWHAEVSCDSCQPEESWHTPRFWHRWILPNPLIWRQPPVQLSRHIWQFWWSPAKPSRRWGQMERSSRQICLWLHLISSADWAWISAACRSASSPMLMAPREFGIPDRRQPHWFEDWWDLSPTVAVRTSHCLAWSSRPKLGFLPSWGCCQHCWEFGWMVRVLAMDFVSQLSLSLSLSNGQAEGTTHFDWCPDCWCSPLEETFGFACLLGRSGSSTELETWLAVVPIFMTSRVCGYRPPNYQGTQLANKETSGGEERDQELRGFMGQLANLWIRFGLRANQCIGNNKQP